MWEVISHVYTQDYLNTQIVLQHTMRRVLTRNNNHRMFLNYIAVHCNILQHFSELLSAYPGNKIDRGIFGIHMIITITQLSFKNCNFKKKWWLFGFFLCLPGQQQLASQSFCGFVETKNSDRARPTPKIRILRWQPLPASQHAKRIKHNTFMTAPCACVCSRKQPI